MTRFHTDEYIDCLARVTPETFDEMTGHGQRCELQDSRMAASFSPEPGC